MVATVVDAMGCQVKSATSKHRKHSLPHFQEEVQVQFKPLLHHNCILHTVEKRCEQS